MKLVCPKCQGLITAENVNVSTDLATCAACNEIFKASELMADVDLSENLEPPTGSGIEFRADTDESGAFLIPKRRFTGSDVFPLIFATFWICFVAFWTWGASQGSWAFAAFSIPFWAVGIFMWRGVIIGLTEREEIGVGPDELTIFKKSVVSSRLKAVPYSDIESIDIENIIPRDPVTMARHMRHFTNPTGMTTGLPMPTIVHGTKKTNFAENVSEAEKKWLTKVLKAIVYKKAGKTV